MTKLVYLNITRAKQKIAEQGQIDNIPTLSTNINYICTSLRNRDKS